MAGLPGTPLTPDPLPGPREALVIATTTYKDPELRKLRAPAHDIEELAEVLTSPHIGGFNVVRVIDRGEGPLTRAIDKFLSARGRDDIVVLYLSCHGVLDRRGRLYFAAADTLKNQLGSTAISSAWLLDQLEECGARRRILILDCCFSGSFAHGTKGDADLDLERRLVGQGRGHAVLTASRAGEYSFEGQALPDAKVAGSVFTAGLIKGLRSGAADADGDGYVSLDEAYAYAYRYVLSSGANQTPQQWLYGGEGAMVLARNPSVETDRHDGPLLPAGTEAPGQTFGRFRLDKLLETRDGAQFYQAYDMMAGHVVTVEILPPELSDEASVRERFLSETAKIASLAEPHVVSVWHSDVHDGRLFAVLPPQDGKRLATALRGGRSLGQDAAVAVVEDVAAALDALHGHGIVDLDLRPDSVFLARATGSACLFALSAARFAARGASTVRDVAYAAPERLRGAPVDQRVDVYGLTCLLYECLTGQPPYPGATIDEVVSKHLRAPIPQLTDFRSSVAAPMNHVIAKGLAKDKADRYASASALAAAARAAIAPLPESAPVTTDGPRYLLGRLLTTFSEVVRPPATKILGEWPTALLRLAVGLGSLAVVGLWILCAYWGAATQMRKPGDPLDLSAPRIAGGLLILPGFAWLAAVTGVFTYYVCFAFSFLTSRGRRGWRTDTRWEAAGLAVWVGAVIFIGVTFFLIPSQLAWMLQHGVVSFTDANWVVGLGVAVAGIVIGLLSLSSLLVLGQRSVRVSDRFSDRRFSQLVGAAALIAAAAVIVAVAATGVGGTARWALFVGAWAVVWVCFSCLVVELRDRASSLGSYLSGAAMTLAAGGGSLIAFAFV